MATQSDGSDVVSIRLNDTFQHGLFVAMSDDKTFHYYRWEDIAGQELKRNSLSRRLIKYKATVV
ncbi:hypothetical protein KUH03_37775 [Sphingobacterium sp. E70]|uniref:hypothetical protein n=1 Tax=Sphingobacterium sp. E70 TaxID=2853439 RepID=UPI00211B7A00|nr:hypothetical protein [Sphingobacterium sp. E70]ULT24625.1 hypothetical protein KUH03_37775 [Sphingobacterium sp. E70]